MSTDLLKNIVPTSKETIEFPPIIFSTLLSFSNAITPIVTNQGPPITYQTIMNIHDNLVNIIDLSIRYSEVTHTISEDYPAISIPEVKKRYKNFISLDTGVEDIFQHIINLQILLSGDANLYMSAAQRNELITVIYLDCERLRLAGNVLMKSTRVAEDSLKTDDPTFVCLDSEWFED